MLGDPDADYINANYIDVSASPFTSADLALPAPGSLCRQGRNPSGDNWGFRWLGSEHPHLLESVLGAQRKRGPREQQPSRKCPADFWD